MCLLPQRRSRRRRACDPFGNPYGEIKFRDDNIGGIGVHIAAQALAQAGGREVVVTQTVRDLATGTDLAFSPLGAVKLRGIPGEWELFAAWV